MQLNHSWDYIQRNLSVHATETLAPSIWGTMQNKQVTAWAHVFVSQWTNWRKHSRQPHTTLPRRTKSHTRVQTSWVATSPPCSNPLGSASYPGKSPRPHTGPSGDAQEWGHQVSPSDTYPYHPNTPTLSISNTHLYNSQACPKLTRKNTHILYQ